MEKKEQDRDSDQSHRRATSPEGVVLSQYVCKNCWAISDLQQQEDLKRAYPEEDFCHGFSCWEKPLLGPSRDMYCAKCKRPGRSRSRSQTSTSRRDASRSTTASSTASLRVLIPRNIANEMQNASREEIIRIEAINEIKEIEAIIGNIYEANLLRQWSWCAQIPRNIPRATIEN